DGAHAQPTQAVLALFSMQQVCPDLSGRRVVIIGDIAHSRVVRSNIMGLRKLGAEVTVCGPKTMMPAFVEELGAEVSFNIDEVLGWCDIAMALRIQLERQDDSTGRFSSIREYHRMIGITIEHLEINQIGRGSCSR